MNRTAHNNYQITTDIPERVWDGFVASEPTGNFLQTTAWGALKSRWGWRPERVAVRREGVLAAGAQILFRSFPLGRSIAYIPRGPVAPDNDSELLAELFSAVHLHCRKNGALLLTIEPHWSIPSAGIETLETLGFRHATAVQPKATILLDLRPSEEAILAQMHSKWRYNIRLSERKDVQVRVGSEVDFDIFHQLTTVTGERDLFATRPGGYYEDVWRSFQPEHSRLLIAEHNGRALAAIMIVRVGRVVTYLYGASSNEERNRMPNHALQWAAIQWARQEGCHWYDFWGIPPEVPADGQVETLGEGGLWGVFRFKQGFGGKVVRYPGGFDYPYSRMGYYAYQQLRARRGGGESG